MKLPFRENAYVPKEKLINYLLSKIHSDGKIKAKLFRRLGFNETNTSKLEKSLLNIAHTKEVKNIVQSIHGIKYVIDGEIKSPKGRILRLRTVWIIEPIQSRPRFITAYPV